MGMNDILLVRLQNPGRVVTLIHKEDWDHFSGSVRLVRLVELLGVVVLIVFRSLQDPFPDDDVVWGTISPRSSWENSLIAMIGSVQASPTP